MTLARVDGLYGHIQRNNAKGAILIASFLTLFLITQFSFRMLNFWPMAQAEANGLDIPPVPPDAPLIQRLLGSGNITTEFVRSALLARDPDEIARKRAHNAELWALAESVGAKGPPIGLYDESELADPPDVATDGAAAAVTRPTWTPTIFDAIRLMFERSQYLGLQCLGLLLLALYFIYTSARRTGLLVRYATRSRPIERREYPELYNLVENLALTAGLPCPVIELIESDKLNAYATGLTPHSARLGLTTGLIATLDRRELEAVLAHEITHIRHGDTRLMAITRACADLVVEQPRRMWLALRRKPRFMPKLLYIPFFVLFILPAFVPFIINPIAFVVLIGIPALAALGALACKAMMHHSREFVADAGAVELTKNPAALVSALRKMAGLDATLAENSTAQAMMFAGSDGGWLSTHPTLASRIEAITVHSGIIPGEVHTTRMPQRTVRPTASSVGLPSASGAQARGLVAGQAAVFGRRGQALAPLRQPSSGLAARSFAHASTPQAIWSDKLPPAPKRDLAGSPGAPQPTLREQIEMEGFETYLKNRPKLAILFYGSIIVTAPLTLPLLARVTAWFGYH